MNHQKLAVGLGNANKGVLSANGHAAYLALTATGDYYDPFVGGQPFGADMLTFDHTSLLYAIGEQGELLWGIAPTDMAGVTYVYLGETNLSGPLTGDNFAAGVGFDTNGNAVWYDSFHIYRGTSDWSTAILGSGAFVFNAVLGPNRELGWSGGGSNTGGFRDAFIESSNISAGVLGGGTHFGNMLAVNGFQVEWSGAVAGDPTDLYRGPTNVSLPALGSGPRTVVGKAISGNAVALWQGSGDTTSGVFDTFKNTTNLSKTALGTSPDRSSQPVAISEAGVALWRGQSLAATSAQPDLFLDTTNFSSPILGGGREATGLGFTSNGTIIWAGRGDTTNGYLCVFSGTTNVTKEAYGKERNCFLLAKNKAGQILWRGIEDDLSTTIWISSPKIATTLSGTIELGGVSPAHAHTVHIQLLEPATANVLYEGDLNVDAAGAYNLSLPITGLFDVRLSIPHFLTRIVRGVPAIGVSALSTELINGDATLDNKVDLKDMNQVFIEFGETVSDDPTDLSENGVVDLKDLNLTFLNFGMNGD